MIEGREVITIGNEKYFCRHTKEQVQARLYQLAANIAEDFQEADITEPPILLPVLMGGSYVAVKLSRCLDEAGFLYHTDAVRIKSYTGKAQREKPTILNFPVEDLSGRHIIVVEDIIDHGDTLNVLHDYLTGFAHPPASIRYLALCIRENLAPQKFKIDYFGFTLGPQWMFGEGADYKETRRGIDGIYIEDK